eukprot:tig00000145_g8804.t1
MRGSAHAFLSWLLALQLCGALVLGSLPPGSDIYDVSRPVGQFALCVGSVTSAGDPYANPPALTLGLVQGTNALLEDSSSLAYDEYNHAIWYGTGSYLYKIDPKACTMEKQLGQASGGNADGDSTTASFAVISSFAPLPNRKVLLGDNNCRLRLYDPASNTVAAFGGLGDSMGTAGGAAVCSAITAWPVNTVEQPPNVAQTADTNAGRMVMGYIQGLAYSPLDGRVYVAWASGSGDHGEVWSMRTDGSDVLVVAITSSGGPSSAFAGLAADRGEPYLYAVSQDKIVYKIGTRPPYTRVQLTAALSSGQTYSGKSIAFVQNAAGGLARLLVQPAGGAPNFDTHVLDRDGNPIGTGLLDPGFPSDMCPGGAADTSCWNFGIVTSTPDGLIYTIWMRSGFGQAIYAYRVLPRASHIKISI